MSEEPGGGGRHQPGDVGRRIALRREKLGLTREELATRAAMSPAYLQYVEEQPAEISAGALLRLAGALQMTVRQLLGAGVDAPPGPGRPSPRAELIEMSTQECHELLARRGVGRVAVTTPEGPRVFPVNYSVIDGAVVYRTAPGTRLAASAGEHLAFETDQIDDGLSTGWSVLVTGIARHVPAPAADRPRPEPWAGGDRDLYVRIEPEQITGRRIRVS